MFGSFLGIFYILLNILIFVSQIQVHQKLLAVYMLCDHFGGKFGTCSFDHINRMITLSVITFIKVRKVYAPKVEQQIKTRNWDMYSLLSNL
jgi:hypothetical protein